jgi:hypothetical protein
LGSKINTSPANHNIFYKNCFKLNKQKQWSIAFSKGKQIAKITPKAAIMAYLTIKTSKTRQNFRLLALVYSLMKVKQASILN